MELVTEPVLHDAQTAGNFARELQILLRTLGAGEANMEKGQMRVEANISVSRDGTLGTKTEVKNLNSFKSVERAITYEIERQIKTLEEGGTLVQETRGFDEVTGTTFSQRLKESSHDYRYFPDPDIPKFKLSVADTLSISSIKKELPELPWERRARYLALGIQPAEVETLIADHSFTEFLEEEVLARIKPESQKTAINYLLSDVRSMDPAVLSKFGGGRYAAFIDLIAAGTVSSRGAKDVLAQMAISEADPSVIAKELGVEQKSDIEQITRIAEKVLQSNAEVVALYKAGKVESLKFLIGQGMKESKGSANPAVLSETMQKLIETMP
jgi:aspartyl-tRNA(Asn)/glutamyl-tRNA(Gln) amidotransferase subunit B